MNALETIRVNGARRDLRSDRRYDSPPLELEIEGRRFTAINWSLGGFLLDGELPLAVGATISGTLRMASSDGFTFAARLVRKDVRGRGLAFQFKELTPLALRRSERAPAPARPR